ncbi:MAG: type I 3-dehydroquinate dehydratase [Candidatus Bathyarchaeia archaeon]
MRPRICVPLPIKTFSDIIPMIRRAENVGADLIEIRFDYMGINDLSSMNRFEGVVEQSSLPLIATNRQYEQGGKCLQNEDLRVKTLIKSAELGFQYVDLELTTRDLNAIVHSVRNYGAKPILSFHDFNGTPALSQMEKIVKEQRKTGAEICKLVTTANSVEDSIQCLLFTKKMSEITKIVCFAMGRDGVLSRILSPFFGSYFTFASLKSGLETAPDQISITELKKIYRKLGVIE